MNMEDDDRNTMLHLADHQMDVSSLPETEISTETKKKLKLKFFKVYFDVSYEEHLFAF